MASEWFYSRGDGQQIGPVTSRQLKELAGTGQLQATDLIWREGLDQWTEASQAKGLFPSGTAMQGSPASGTAVAEAAIEPTAGLALAPATIAEAAIEPPSSFSSGASQSVLAYQSPEMGVTVATPRTLELLKQTRPWVLLFAILAFVIGGLLVVIGVIGGVLGLVLAGSRRGPGTFAPLILIIYVPLSLLYIVPGLYLSRYAARIRELMGSRSSAALESAIEAQRSFWRLIGIIASIGIGLWLLILVIAMIATAL